MRLIRRVINQIALSCYASFVEPKKIEDALKDDYWINVMHDELNQFIRNDIWYLVPRPISFFSLLNKHTLLKEKNYSLEVTIRKT